MCMKTIFLPPSPKLVHAMREQGKAIQNVLFSFSIYKVSNMAVPNDLNIHFQFSV